MTAEAVIMAWNQMRLDERVSLMEVAPQLAEAVADLAAHDETRRWRVVAMSMKARALEERGAHVPEWMKDIVVSAR